MPLKSSLPFVTFYLLRGSEDDEVEVFLDLEAICRHVVKLNIMFVDIPVLCLMKFY